MNKVQVLHALYLAYVLGVLSWAAWRTKVRLESAAGAPGAKALPSRERILTSTLISLLILLLFSWKVANFSDIPVFARPELGAREIVAALAVFAGHFGLRQVAIALHTREEMKKSLLVAWMPRTAREWVLYVLVALAAGVAEEASYRGVVWTLLTWYTGQRWLAALISAVAFGFAHASQRWKSAVVISGIALMMHGFVAFTGSLVLAMVVHAAYDVAVGVVISRRLARQTFAA